MPRKKKNDQQDNSGHPVFPETYEDIAIDPTNLKKFMSNYTSYSESIKKTATTMFHVFPANAMFLRRYEPNPDGSWYEEILNEDKVSLGYSVCMFDITAKD